MSIQNIFNAYKIQLTASEERIFERFLVLFREYNAHTNLSAIRDEEGVVEKHFVDSLVLEQFLEIQGKVLDIGTGGGFPGIPLAIRHPDARLVLLDSVGKKVRACEHFAKNLSLQNIVCLHGRAEEVVSSSLRGAIRPGRESDVAILRDNITQDRHTPLHFARDDEFFHWFDFVLSRATAYLPQILQWAEPFLASDGQIVLYKLPSEEELRDGMDMAKKLALKLVRQERYSLAGQERILMFFSRT